MNTNLDIGFKDTLYPLFACGAEVETNEHFLLWYQLNSTYRSKLFGKVVKVNVQFLNLTAKDQALIRCLCY